ncbi:MAG: hypothetical protein IPJ43_04840 [Saprospiraceae bacterium]|nr:hypothetical protein [Saprospiraceae bacterium]
MMSKQKSLFILFFLCLSLYILAQKYDFNWMFGYEFGPLDPLDSTEGVNRLSFDTEVGNPRLNSLNCSN